MLPQDERRFRAWYSQIAQQYGLDSNPDAPDQFYDYRAAFRAGAKPDETGHWPSEFKLAGHPNLNVGGFDTRTGARVPGTEQAPLEELIRRGWDSREALTMTARETPPPNVGRALIEQLRGGFRPPPTTDERLRELILSRLGQEQR